MTLLFLDDDKYRYEQAQKELSKVFEIHWAQNSKEFFLLLSKNKYDIISLDHDLGKDEDDGNDIINQWIDQEELFKHCSNIVIHSLNPIGAENMKSKLQGFFSFKDLPCWTTILPFGSTWLFWLPELFKNC